MKYRNVLLIFFILLLASFVPSVYAHTLKIDGNIGVNVHIEPDDAPVSKSESKILVDITDKSGRFNPANPGNCACFLSIVQNGKELTKMAITTGGMFNQLRYTFPEGGSYQVKIEGKPNGNGLAFQGFSVIFEYYVKGAGSISSIPSARNPLRDQFALISILAGSAIIMLFLIPTRSSNITQAQTTQPKAPTSPIKWRSRGKK